MKTKIWLDDYRPCPWNWVDLNETNWIWVQSARECFDLVLRGNIEIIDLDHDLDGFDDIRKPTGYDLLCWIENAVVERKLSYLPIMKVHSQNPVGVKRMRQAIDKIQQLYDKEKK